MKIALLILMYLIIWYIGYRTGKEKEEFYKLDRDYLQTELSIAVTGEKAVIEILKNKPEKKDIDLAIAILESRKWKKYLTEY